MPLSAELMERQRSTMLMLVLLAWAVLVRAGHEQDPPWAAQIQALLSSIDDRLRSLDAFGYTLKLSRLDFTLEHLAKRTEGVESKLMRLDLRMGELGEKFETRAALLDRKLERVDAKLDDLSNGVAEEELRRLANRSESALQRLASEPSRLDNLTAALAAQEGRIRSLDSDVQRYARKVVHGIQDVWRTADEVRAAVATAGQLDARAREVERGELRLLREQVEPLAELGAELAREAGSLRDTVDASFATLLVAQNAFIDSCRRVQHEETHVYDVLRRVVHEMRNRSEADVRRIGARMREQTSRIERSLARAAAELQQDCVLVKLESCSELESLCRRDSNGTDTMYDFEAEPPVNEYEDYQPYYTESN